MVENKIVKSVRKFAEPTEKWLKAYILTNKKQPLSKVAFHLSEMGQSCYARIKRVYV